MLTSLPGRRINHAPDFRLLPTGRLTMKKSVLAAFALASATAFTGASAAPATVPAAESQAAHTLRWRLTETASHELVMNAVVGSDVIRSARTGELVGYDSTTLKFYPQTNSARVQVAAAVKGGILVYGVHGRFTSNDVVFHGRVLRGTGKFAGAQGTVAATPSADGKKVFVVIHYAT